jgi:hypothetical protein
MAFNEFIEQFKEGDHENIKKYFNDLKTFFKVLDKRGLLEDVVGDIDYNLVSGEEWENDIFLYLYENKMDKFNSLVDDFLSDVKYVNGVPYLVISDISELASLFCDDRDIGRSTIESVLSQEDFYERYYDTTQDVVNDVINELNPENLKILEDYLVNVFGDQKFYAETSLLERISESQTNDGMAQITSENVSEIINDNETLEYLIDTDEFSDFKSELYDIHSSAYNSAYESDLWDEVWSELSRYFEGKPEYLYFDRGGKKTEFAQLKFRDFNSHIIPFLKENQGYHGYHSVLSYYGSFISLMSDADCLRLRFPDYPDWRKITENINYYFADYF